MSSLKKNWTSRNSKLLVLVKTILPLSGCRKDTIIAIFLLPHSLRITSVFMPKNFSFKKIRNLFWYVYKFRIFIPFSLILSFLVTLWWLSWDFSYLKGLKESSDRVRNLHTTRRTSLSWSVCVLIVWLWRMNYFRKFR